jgi:hypothetical protein
MDPERRAIFDRVNKRLEELRKDWDWLARQLGNLYPQKLYQWKRRGIPPAEYDRVARALRWSVDEMLGIPTAPKVGAGGAWPFVTVSLDRLLLLSPADRLHIEAEIALELERIEVARREKNERSGAVRKAPDNVRPLRNRKTSVD